MAEGQRSEQDSTGEAVAFTTKPQTQGVSFPGCRGHRAHLAQSVWKGTWGWGWETRGGGLRAWG